MAKFGNAIEIYMSISDFLETINIWCNNTKFY